MSKIHFLVDKSKNDLFENVNFFSRDSISNLRQGWRDLVQRILNNELKTIDLDLNIFPRYQLINEYKIEEYERIYKVHTLPLFRFPSRGIIRSISVRIGSILRYSTIKMHMTRLMIIPSLVQFRHSVIEDQTERKKLFTQKRVTILSPNKRSSSIEDYSLLLISPKWRHSIDERHQRSSDDLHQIIKKAIRKNSYDIHHPNNLSRLSLRSISYGFGLETKPWKTIQQETIPSSPNYRLPANKIELDLNQQEIIRRSGSFKKHI